MSDYGLATQIQNKQVNSSYDSSPAFADAVQRARQIAAKIHTSGNESNNLGGGTKRPLDENMDHLTDGSPDVKKLATVSESYGVPVSGIQPRKGKELIGQIVSRGAPPFPSSDPNHVAEGHIIVEILIPAGKVGLVIGKGGETIRNLQERAAVKMVMIQEGPQQTGLDKPLRITGEPEKCELAKQMVMDLITEKELETVQRGNFAQNTNEYGSVHGGNSQEIYEVSYEERESKILVPRQAVGVVIGKGGDMIKRIQQDSGAKIQFQQNSKEDGPGDKMCIITGGPDQVQTAANIVNELIHSVLMRDQQNVGRGRGRGRGGGGGGGGNSGGGGGFDGSEFGPGPKFSRQNTDGRQEVHFPVPANKCGLVIGKGGETIRSLNQQTGAHVELSRATPPNPYEKIFIIRGNPQQIDHARSLITERIGGPPMPNGHGPFPPPCPQPYSQQMPPPPPPPPPQQYGPQGWPNTYQSWQNQAPVPNDPNKAATDANAAAWVAYYAQYYNQQAPQPTQQQPMQPVQQQPQPQPAAPVTTAGQPDYSAAWIEYYRSLGMYKEAEAIEQQARANQAQAAPQQAAVPVPHATPVAQPQPAAPVVQPPQQAASVPQQPTQPTYPPTSAAPPPQWGAPAPYQPAPNPYGQQNPYPNYNYNTYAAAPQ